jgi:hypothetical protein
LDERADSVSEYIASSVARRCAKQARTGCQVQGWQDTKENRQVTQEDVQGRKEGKARQRRQENIQQENIQKGKGRTDIEKSQTRQGRQESDSVPARGQNKVPPETLRARNKHLPCPVIFHVLLSPVAVGYAATGTESFLIAADSAVVSRRDRRQDSTLTNV